MSRIYIPVTNAEQWAQFLADPVKHWRMGYSARTLAHSWQDAENFPVEVREALETYAGFSGINLLLAIPEHQVPLPGGSRPSQNDLWVLARAGEELVSITVEGKVMEPFGPTIDEWNMGTSSGKDLRLNFLMNELGLQHPVPKTIRYQLLHRTASAVIEAKRFRAAHAVMLVHSFSLADQWFDDFAAFVALFGCAAKPDQMIAIGERDGVFLHLCWVRGNPAYLRK